MRTTASGRWSPRPGSLVTSSHQHTNIIFANHVGGIGLPFRFEPAGANLSDATLFLGGGAMSGESTDLAPMLQSHPSGTRVPMEKIVAAVEQPSPELRPNVPLWRERPELNLAQWRALTGNDGNSLMTRISDDDRTANSGGLVQFPGGRREASVIDELWKVKAVGGYRR